MDKTKPIIYKGIRYSNIDDCSRKTGKKRAVVKSLIRKGVIGWAEDNTHPITLTKCLRCGRKLKDPKSIELGYGPTCYSKISRGKSPLFKIKKPGDE